MVAEAKYPSFSVSERKDDSTTENVHSLIPEIGPMQSKPNSLAINFASQ